ncbi:hybrid sensor histidine kinase/response regulator [Leptolyngbya iicbica]|uniref:histidine kinase n=2 Tax=Cyanophyceae TaxID=3028117 RepID=A0A4Q7EEX8_9CYAN|nr:hybrid sensor histidine kinase/response regulator [Leptolyngbya sp. LK]RZM81795.1 hybrid sensor histidine kinase/response regulator [Leptolyngbya sp. LK]
MRIEDDELRGIYKTSSEERLQTLDAGLLHLEQQPDDADTLDSLMREAHSLKGDSSMLDQPEIGKVAHSLETILKQVQRGEQAFTAELGDRLAQGLAAMRQMIHHAVTGDPCDATAERAIAAMNGTPLPAAPLAPPESEPDGVELFGEMAEDDEAEAAPAALVDTDTDPNTDTDTDLLIADAELRAIFKTSSEERLQALDTGLLQLEQQPEDTVTLDLLMREAHSLKGDSNMLGLKDLGTLAHQLEHLLGAIQRHEERFSPDMGDRLAHGLDAMRQLAHQAVTGIPAHVNVFYVLAELMGASVPATAAPNADVPVDLNSAAVAIAAPKPVPPESSTPAPESTNGSAPPAANRAATANPPPPADSTAGGAPSAAYRIETIRVPTHNLDALMTQTGELTVTKIRVTHRLGEIEEISNLWEDWSRDLFSHRFLLHEVQQGRKGIHQLETFQHRNEQYLEQLGTLINRLQGSLYEDTTRLEMISGELEEGIRTLRLLPLSTIFNLYPRLVRDLARQEHKSVKLAIAGADTRADKRILEEMKDPLLHMIRNAIDHGIESPEERVRQGKPETATITLRGYQTPTSIVIEVSDDGRGLNVEAIKQTALRRGICRPEELESMTPGQIQNLILSPGFSTRTMVTEISGRGVGLDVLRTNVERLKGSIEVSSEPGQGCTIRVQLGTTLATAHVLIVSVSNNTYAIPVEFVQTACLVKPDDIFTIEGRNTILHDDRPISVVQLSDLLELAPSKVPIARRQSPSLACIILRSGADSLGIFVDALVDEQDVVLKPQSQLLKRVRNISGATILGTGEVCMVLNPQDLMQSVRRRSSRPGLAATATAMPQQAPERPARILLVEDSIATRTQEKRILEAAGYQVVTAVDGMEGFNKLQLQAFDAVVSDVQMPNLDGLGLTERIRQHREYNELPVVLVTTLASDRDRQRGAEAGANAYITKGSFNQEVLLETLQRLI